VRNDIFDIWGGVGGTLNGIVTGLVGIIGGLASGNWGRAAVGGLDLGAALIMPRLGSSGGLRHPGPGQNLMPASTSRVNLASGWHDDLVARAGYWNSSAQFGWIERAWAGPGIEPGLYGQAYRILGTIGFGIAGVLQWATGP
jgi:hypothetical protein